MVMALAGNANSAVDSAGDVPQAPCDRIKILVGNLGRPLIFRLRPGLFVFALFVGHT